MLLAADAETRYRRASNRELEHLSTVFRNSMDPETNTKLFAHMSLLSAKGSLNDLRSRLTRALADDTISPAQSGELFFAPLRRTFDEYAGLAFIRRCEIVPARLGPLAGLSGAAALVLDDL